MKIKNRYSLRIVVMGVIITVAAYFAGQMLDIMNTQKKLDDTFVNLRQQCANYDNVINADVTKSIVRLVEQTTELRRDIKDNGVLPDDDTLKEFASDQRLAGIAILDRNLKPERLYTDSKLNYDDWQNVIYSDTVSSIKDYSKKVYCERIENNGLFDIAAISRFDADGIIICWRYQNSKYVAESQVSLENLLAGYDAESNVRMYITDEEVIHGTNDSKMQGKSVNDFPVIKELDAVGKYGKLTRINPEGHIYYGGKERCGNYVLYAYYPYSQVISIRVLLVPFVVALYALCCLLGYMIQARIEKHHVEEAKRRIETINSISSIYVVSILINLKNDSFDIINIPSSFMPYLYGVASVKKLAKIMCEHFADDGDRELYRDFIDPDTVAERLWGNMFIESNCLGKDGVWYKNIIIPNSVDSDGNINSVILVARNIDEQKKTELKYQKQLEKTTEEALRANAEKTEFLRRMSHDIRTPINVIMGMTEMGDKFPDDIERQKYCREKVHAASAILLELVNDVLSLNKIDSGKFILDEKEFDIRNCLGEIYSIIDTQAAAKQINFKITPLATEHCHLIGSPLHVRQVIMNILGNAVKYTPNGGKIVASFREISFDGKTSVTEFECTDNGIGMSQEFQEHMFEAFVQEKNAAGTLYNGIGLGLAIVKKLVEKMNGTISVDSSKGKGTKFTVRLPFVVDLSKNAEQVGSTEVETKFPEGVKILLVEDNELNMEIAEFILNENGAIVIEAKDGKEAFDIWKNSEIGDIDLVLMDLMMPVMNGIDAARAIRTYNRKDAKTVPIIAMSANAFDEDVKSCYDAGMNEHISKPIDADKLIKCVNKYVRKDN